jgi:hypothetical protein
MDWFELGYYLSTAMFVTGVVGYIHFIRKLVAEKSATLG